MMITDAMVYLAAPVPWRATATPAPAGIAS
jgi:hypothetical protein